MLLLHVGIVSSCWCYFFALVLFLCVGVVAMLGATSHYCSMLVLLLCVGAFASDVLHWCLCNCAIFSLHCYCRTNISLHTQIILKTEYKKCIMLGILLC